MKELRPEFIERLKKIKKEPVVRVKNLDRFFASL